MEFASYNSIKKASVHLVFLLKVVKWSRRSSEYSLASFAFVPDSHFRVNASALVTEVQATSK